MLQCPYAHDQEETGDHQEAPAAHDRHRFKESAGCDAQRTDRPSRRPPEETQKGQPLPPRAHQDGSGSPQPPQSTRKE